MKLIQTFFIICCMFICVDSAAQYIMLDKAIAEDDHAHRQPLINALELKFAGVSASLNLKKDGTLTCGSGTLKDIYLEPLNARVKTNNGFVYEGYHDEFILILEIRSDEESTLKALEKELEAYRDMLTEISDGKVNKKAVRIVAASRNGKAFEYKHMSSVIFQEIPFLELPAAERAEFSGMSGLDFRKVYDWSGLGNMPNMQYHSFNSGLKVAQRKGYRTRVYNFPEVPGAMELFLNAGASYLQIKDRAAFVKFMKGR